MKTLQYILLAAFMLWQPAFGQSPANAFFEGTPRIWVPSTEPGHVGHVIIIDGNGTRMRVDLFRNGGRFLLTIPCNNSLARPPTLYVVAAAGGPASIRHCAGNFNQVPRKDVIGPLLERLRISRETSPEITMYLTQLRAEMSQQQ